MLTKKIEAALKKKSKDDLKKYKFIGAEIKSSRLRLSKTLDSICNVNKSISYISKIENNKIIPNESSLMELCDALYITKDELESMSKFDDCIIEALNAVYRYDIEKMMKLYKKYSSFSNVRTDLMKGLYYLMFKDYENLNPVIENLKKVESSLSLEDYLIYALLSLDDLYNKKELLQALKVSNVVLKSETATGVMLKLFKMYEFQIKVGLNISRFDYEYDEILKIHAQCSNIVQIKNTINMYSELLIELGDDKVTDEFISNLESIDLKCYAYCKKNDIINATKYYHNDIDIKYKLYYLYKNREYDKLINELLTPLNNDLLVIGNCYKLELENHDEFYRAYLVNIVIPYYSSKGKISFLLKYYDKLVTLNTKLSKYKDSGVLGQEVARVIQNITKELA